MASMSEGETDAFLRETRIAKLAYLTVTGAPTIVPIWYAWDGAAARMFTSRGSPKVRRLIADPRAALTVEEPVGVAERWVTIEGAVGFESEGTIELLMGLARRYYTGAKAEQAIVSWGANPEMWVTLVLTPKRIRSSA